MTAVPDLVAVVDRLLAPEGGCVWNRAQTHASLAHYAVEEAYELVDAIDEGDDDDLREELGDVLYQVVLHAGVSAAAGGFDLEDVAAGVRDKMVRRHPHVFGDERADTEDEVVRVWRAAKAAEKAGRRSVFDGVPRAMPPLERAVKLLERLEERGDADAVLAAVTGAGSGTAAAPGAGAGTAAAPGAGAGASGAGHGVASAGAGRADESQADGSSDPGADARWGIAVLEQVAAARAAGIDPVAGLRAAVGMLEARGRDADEAEVGRG
ncbi:MazG family protein [Curtobacterium sp. MCBA15_004]|uniref:MazG family protein n=1 Tax=unclassified Curtobacterium TaxID=257496 RepID=UPI0008DCD92D|nr:MazG family protein [Curtobacterium sp. MCBA15_004]WIA97600.1 MazG family protein [Curtobacterium sp. MCBA15_004]